MRRLEHTTIPQRVLLVILIVSAALGFYSSWLFWRPGELSMAAGGFPLVALSAFGIYAAWRLYQRFPIGLLLAAIFFGLQIIGVESENAGFAWSLQAGLIAEISITFDNLAITINIVALVLTAWSLLLYRQALRTQETVGA